MQWRRLLVLWMSPLGVLAACGSDFDDTPWVGPVAAARTRLSASSSDVDFADTCAAKPFVGSPLQPFASDVSRKLSAHSHHHGGADTIVAPGSIAEVTAWFDYGLLMQPIAHEQVRLFSQTCSAATRHHNVTWTLRGETTTDAWGRATVRFDPEASGTGKLDILFEVAGDGTQARASLYILPPGTHFVVFDIDGTLSQNNRSFWEEVVEHMVHYEQLPPAFAGAVALTHAWRAKGYVPLYLTNRPHQLADLTRAWLALEGFASGPLLVSSMARDLWPRIDGAGTYKLATLRTLQERGHTIDFAYGNEATDIYAYRQAGIPMQHVFSIGTHAGVGGSQAILGDYSRHLSFVANQPHLDVQDGHTLGRLP